MGVKFRKCTVTNPSSTAQVGIPGIDYVGEQVDEVIIADYKVKIVVMSGLKVGDGSDGELLSNKTKAYGLKTDKIEKGQIINMVSGEKYKILTYPTQGLKYTVMWVEEV